MLQLVLAGINTDECNDGSQIYKLILNNKYPIDKLIIIETLFNSVDLDIILSNYYALKNLKKSSKKNKFKYVNIDKNKINIKLSKIQFKQLPYQVKEIDIICDNLLILFDNLPNSLTHLSLLGSKTNLDYLPGSLIFLELSDGYLMEDFVNLPSGLKTIKINNTTYNSIDELSNTFISSYTK